MYSLVLNTSDHMNKEELREFVSKNVDNFAIQLKRHHNQLYNEIDKLYDFPKFTEKLYVFINGEESIGHCKICNKKTQFDGYWKGYSRIYCSYTCRSKEKSDKANEMRKCVVCGGGFRIYKKREKTTCTNKCLLELNATKEVNDRRQKSIKKTMLKKYGVNHPSKLSDFKTKIKSTKLKRYNDENYVNVDKARDTKLKLYGDENYINTEKIRETCMIKYGVPNVFHLLKNKSNGKQISKFQKREYKKILDCYPDAELEKYLPDVQKSVDIYIPSKKKIVECFGDFWHCNPSIYPADYYNKYVHMNASEIWKRDEERIQTLKTAGYDIEVVWENTNRNFKHSVK